MKRFLITTLIFVAVVAWKAEAQTKIYSIANADGVIVQQWTVQQSVRQTDNNNTFDQAKFHESGITPVIYTASRIFLSFDLRGYNLENKTVWLVTRLKRNGILPTIGSLWNIKYGYNQIGTTLDNTDYNKLTNLLINIDPRTISANVEWNYTDISNIATTTQKLEIVFNPNPKG